MSSHKRSRATFENQAARPPFAFFGTPLAPPDSGGKDDGSYAPLWKQDVRDEQGRKRLHGAFTGGFSAGYFNTVGSKEGWTPSTYVSSKAQRYQQDGVPVDDEKRRQQYMDDEDLADLKESQLLETQGTFSGLGAANRAATDSSNAMLNLFKPTDDTIGTKLLQKMGWRQGQGIGAKIRRTIDGNVYSLAPEPTQMVAFNRKTDVFGLGFSKTGRLQVGDDSNDDDDEDDGTFARPAAAGRLRAPVKKSGGSGFGVGVLNDNGSDDEDPYELGPRISYGRMVGGPKKGRKSGGGLEVSSSTSSVVGNRLSGRGPKAIGQTRRHSDFRRCHDGSLPIDGFVLSSRMNESAKSQAFLPLPVPPGWVSSRLSSDPPATPLPSVTEASKASTLDAAGRAAMLGEARLPGKSVFDYMTPATRAILVAASGRNDLPQAKSESAPAGYVQSQADRTRRMNDLIPELDRKIALEALERARAGWLPYGEDLDKRARYRTFIEIAAGTKNGLPDRAEKASAEEWTNEMREFVKAAQVFRPVSGLMASRFTSSRSDGQPRDTSLEGSQSGDTTPTPKKEDPALEAAKMNMYGHLTRTSERWDPTRLACKRFGVKPPDHVMPSGDGDEGRGVRMTGDGRLDVTGKPAPVEMQRSAGRSAGVGAGAYGATSGAVFEAVPRQDGRDPDAQGGNVVNVEVNEAIEGQRAGEDLFRAVFGDSDDDEDGEVMTTV